MEFTYQGTKKDIMVLSADGGLNHDTADQFVDELAAMIDAGLTKLVVNGEKLTYISSAGVGALLRLHKRLRAQGGEVHLANLHTPIIEVIELLRLNRVFSIFPSVNEAVDAFGK